MQFDLGYSFWSINNGVLIKKLFNSNASSLIFDEKHDGVGTHSLVE